jgi:hypothetical protein
MSSAKKKYQVFVSSTFEDLQEERREVINALLSADCFPICMEYFSASTDSKWETIMRLIDESDYLIVIVAGKYGSIDENGISYTQKEYEYAIQQNIPTMAFVKNENELKQLQVEKQADAKKKLDEFRRRLLSEKICSSWISSDQLGQKIATSISKAMNDTPRPGWIRADIKEEAINAIDTAKNNHLTDIDVINEKIKKLEDESNKKTEKINKLEDALSWH